METIVHDVARHGTPECVERELWRSCTHKHLACGGTFLCKKECEKTPPFKRDVEQKTYPMRRGKIQKDGTIVWEEDDENEQSEEKETKQSC